MSEEFQYLPAPHCPILGRLCRVGKNVGPCLDFTAASWEEVEQAAAVFPHHRRLLLTAAPARLERRKLAAAGRMTVWDQLDGAIAGAVWPWDDPVLVYDFDAVIRDLLSIFEASDWATPEAKQEHVTSWFYDNLWLANLGPLTPFYLLRDSRLNLPS